MIHNNKKKWQVLTCIIALSLIIIFSVSCKKSNETTKDTAAVKTSSEINNTSTTLEEKETESSTTTSTTTATTTAKETKSNGNISDEIMEFIDPIYFNIIFGSNSYENGITEKDMKLFAISYVYQYEYEGLNFDPEKFILYVPAKRVEELVKEYFDVEVSEHVSYEDDGIMFERGFYLMPAADMNWNEEIIIEDIKELEDNKYELKIMFDSPDGALPKKLITLKKHDGRFILLGYQDIL